MKRALTIAALLFTAATTNAQKVGIGFKAGTNLSTVKTDDSDFNHDRKMRVTYHAGLVTDFSITSSFSIQPQLLLQGKGVGVSHGGHTDKFKFTSLDIPVNFLYNSNGFFAGAGPNVGINLSGKLDAEDDPAENKTFKFGDGAGEFKRLILGANVLAGYRTKSGVFFSANYQTDFTNWSNATNDKWRNSVIGISIGYMLK